MKELYATEKQSLAWKAMDGQAQAVLMHGGARSGKSFIITAKIIDRAQKFAGSRHLIARYRLAHAKSSIWHETLIPLVRGQPGWVIHHGDLCATYRNGSEVWLGGFDDPDRVEKILGHEYCVGPDSLILTSDLRWVPAHSLVEGQELIAFPENLDGHQTLCASMVEKASAIITNRYRIVTDKGTTVVSDGHQFVTSYDDRRHRSASMLSWKRTDRLEIGDNIRFANEPWKVGNDWETGWAAGILDGEGWASKASGIVGMGQNPGLVLDRFCRFLAENGIKYRVHSKGKCHQVCAKGIWASLRLLGITRTVRLVSRGIWEGRRGFNTQDGEHFATVLKVEKIGKGPVIALRTSTKTLIADGFLGHNSTIYPNEVSQISYEAFVMARSRLAQNIPGCVNKAYLDCNPPSPQHWSHRMFFEGVEPRTGKPLERPELYAQVQMNPKDNEKNLPVNYITDILGQLPDRERRRFRDGEWVKPEGTIFDKFSETMIVEEDDIPSKEKFEEFTVGVDFGINFAAVLIGWMGDMIWFLDDWGAFSMTASAANQQMINRWEPEWGAWGVAYCDPSGGERIQEISAGDEADNSVEDGLNWLNQKMERGEFRVTRRCAGWLGEVYDFRRDEKGRVVKQNDHYCFIAGTMVETDKGRRAIEQLHVGDMVLGREGFSPVLAVGSRVVDDTITLRFSDGSSLTGSVDHLIWVDGRGFTALDSIRYGDIMVSCTESKQSPSTASISDGIQTRRDWRTGTTIVRGLIKSGKVLKRFIGRYGKRNADRFHIGTRFITETETLPIIGSRILNWFRSLSTSGNIIAERPVLQRSNILLGSGNSRRRGIVLQRVGPGIANTVGKSQGSEKSLRLNANIAEEVTDPLCLVGSAQTDVSLRGEGNQEWITRRENARDAGRNSHPTDMIRGDSVRVVAANHSIGKRRVYNLTVGYHEYFANGVLVSNCDAARYGSYSRAGKGVLLYV